jgi:hypothetical protein
MTVIGVIIKVNDFAIIMVQFVYILSHFQKWKMHKMNWHSFRIEQRRRKVDSLLVKSMTESWIAKELKVDQQSASFVSRNIVVVSVGMQHLKILVVYRVRSNAMYQNSNI